MKCRYPDVFAAAMLNSQPMGFYAPAQLVRDAREHGVEMREVDVNISDWDHRLETFADGVSKGGAASAPQRHEGSHPLDSCGASWLSPDQRAGTNRHGASGRAPRRRLRFRPRPLAAHRPLAERARTSWRKPMHSRRWASSRRDALWAVRGFEPRRRQGRPAALARGRLHTARTRRAFAADAARRRGRRGLPASDALLESASRVIRAPASCRTQYPAGVGACDDRHIKTPAHHCRRPGAGAPASWLRERRHLHDARRRDRRSPTSSSGRRSTSACAPWSSARASLPSPAGCRTNPASSTSSPIRWRI